MTYSVNIEQTNLYGFELARAAYLLVHNLRPIEKGHQVLISADTTSDMRVVEATAQAVFAVGGIPTVIIYPSLCEPMQPVSAPLIGAASKAEVWFDFANSYQLYTPAYHAALLNGCIYFLLYGMNVDMMVRSIAHVDHKLLRQMGTWLYTHSQAVQTVRVETPAGTHLTMKVNKAGDPFWESPPETGGYTQILGGQSGFLIYRESVEGTLVIDGSISPPSDIGVLHHPITLKIVGGYVQDFQGGVEAQIFEKFLRRDKNPDSLLIDHVCYGFNPGVRKLSGSHLEDAHLFGCVQFGIGAITYGSLVHSDCVCLNPSIWLDDVQIEKNGCYIHSELVKFCIKMGVPGY